MARDTRPGHWLEWCGAPMRAVPLLLLLCFASFVPGLTTLPAIDRDEARFAQASRQMLETGDYIDIRFQDGPRYKKPAGIYWLQSAATFVLGEDPENPIWTYRLPSQAGATLAVLLTYGLGALLFAPSAGLLAGILMACCLLLNVEARLAKTDAMLLATAMAAQLCLARAYLAGRRRETLSPVWAYGFWAALGAAILIKGPVVPMVAALTALTLSALDRRLAWLGALRPVSGTGLMLLIAAPWYLAITLTSQGAFWSEALGHDLLGKVQTAQESHGGPPGYHLLLLGLMFLPGAALLLRALPFAWALRDSTAVRYCLAWILPSWLIFELVPTKLPHYVLPLYPALALLCAAALCSERQPAPAAIRWTGVGFSLLGFILAFVLTAAFVLWGPFVNGQSSANGFIAAAGAIGAAIFALRLAVSDRPPRLSLVAGMVLSTTALYLAAFAYVFPNSDKPWVSQRLAASIERLGVPADRIALAGYGEPSAILHLGTETRLMQAAPAARSLLTGDIDLAVIALNVDPDFRAALGADQDRVVGIDLIEGFNYSKGEDIGLYLYRRGGADD